MQGSDYDDRLVQDHEHTWHGFVKFIIWNLVSIAVLLILMAAFLV
ncbi:aa3-type cytochrome c oxidase subunit IV [Thalassospira australica]